MPQLPGVPVVPQPPTPPLPGDVPQPPPSKLPESWQDPFRFMQVVTDYALQGGPKAMQEIIEFINAKKAK